MDYVFHLPIDTFNLSKFTPFPGSPLYERIHLLGRFVEDWEKMDCMHFQFIPDGMTRERIEHLFIEFHKRHYKRFEVLWDYFTMLWRSPDSWLRFMKSLKHFINFARSDSRLGKS
jgi:hypothetical protein